MDLGRDYWVSASLARLFCARSTSSAFWLRPSTSGVPCRRSLSISLAVLLTQLTHFSRFPSLLSISFLPSSHIPSLLPSSHFPSLSVLSLSLLPSVLSLRIADRSAAEKKNSSKCHAEGHSIPHRRCHVVHFFSLKLRPVSLTASVRRCRPLGPLRGIPSVGAGRPEPTTAMLQRVTGRSEVWEAREGRMVGGGNGRRERERETIALCNFFTFVLIHLYACHKFLSANNLLIRFNLPISLSCVCICTYTYRHSNVYV